MARDRRGKIGEIARVGPEIGESRAAVGPTRGVHLFNYGQFRYSLGGQLVHDPILGRPSEGAAGRWLANGAGPIHAEESQPRLRILIDDIRRILAEKVLVGIWVPQRSVPIGLPPIERGRSHGGRYRGRGEGIGVGVTVPPVPPPG